MSINQTTPSPHASQTQPQTAKQDEMDNKVTKPVAPVSVELSKKSMEDAMLIPESPAPSAPKPFAAAQKHVCQHAGDNCPLANTTVLLSSCIAQQAWITENLLPIHGIREWTTDPEDWVGDPASSRSSPPDPNIQKRKRRPRKICFVEHNRKEATRALLMRLESSPQYTPSGRREYVEVYDWRILEDMTAMEKAFKGSKPSAENPDPKRKWWVGLA